MFLSRRRFLLSSVALSAGLALPVPVLLAQQTIVHVVARGDTLSGLARRYGVSVAQIQQANNLRTTVIWIGQKLTIPTVAGETAPISDATHVVVAGDTLSGLALRYRVSVSAIQRANNLSSTQIRIGQRLTIPGASAGGPVLINHVRSETQRIRVQNDRWRTIVVHHSGIRFGNASSYDNFHRTQRRMQHGLAYHFVIGNGVDSGDGEIEIGGRWRQQLNGGHVRNSAVNEVGIGICLVGNFMETHPTSRQMAAFTQLMEWLTEDVLKRKPQFAGHKEIDRNHTVCPGRHFPLAQMHRQFG
jgi:LysM repeat protein